METFQVLLNGGIAALILSGGVLSALRFEEEPARFLFVVAATCLSIHRFALAYYLQFSDTVGFQSTPVALLLNLVTFLALVLSNIALLTRRKNKQA